MSQAIQQASSPTCKLCRASSEFARSHVIPEFLLKWAYDEKGRFNYVNIKDDEIVSRRLIQNKSEPLKDFDPQLLCRNCETKFSKWETYCSNAFYGWQRIEGRTVKYVDAGTGQFEATIVVKVQYSHFKLFLMSVLWRLSSSDLEICREISLGNAEEELRLVLLNEQPGTFDTYPCVVSGVRLGDYDLYDFVSVESFPPASNNVGWNDSKIGTIRLVAGGFAFDFFPVPKLYPKAFDLFFLKENGDLVLLYKDVRELPGFRLPKPQ